MSTSNVNDKVQQAMTGMNSIMDESIRRGDHKSGSARKNRSTMSEKEKEPTTGRSGVELEERVRQAEREAREAKEREEQAMKRVEDLNGELTTATNTVNAEAAETIERLRVENQGLNATVAERETVISRLERDNAQLRQDATAINEKVQQLERSVAELKEAGEKAQNEAERLKTAQSNHSTMTNDSASPELVQQLRVRNAELETRLADSEQRFQLGKLQLEAMNGSLLSKHKELEQLKEGLEDKNRELGNMNRRLEKFDVANRVLHSAKQALQEEAEGWKQRSKTASDAVRSLERELREVQAQGYVANADSSVVLSPALDVVDDSMDIDGPPELPSPPSSPVAGPIELREVRQRNRRLSQHNDTLRSGQVKIEQEVQLLRADNERLQADNARYEPFVLASEEYNGEVEKLTAENAALCRSNERIREEVEELRTLRDRGLLQDLKSASPNGLVPSGELAGLLAQNMANVFAGIDAVLAETAQRKFTVIDRPQPPTTSLSRRQSMVFKQATRPSTPAFAHTGSIATKSFTAPGESASSAGGWASTTETGWPSG
ncbi:unnamed protein product [Peniophora sp. CBMAI 1063]|nr:unnamed protein product [Peniophora sp. CBMAI 1063]